ncbi:hypothetical protein M2104_005798 [Paenibacillus sp. PastH-2]|nr:hypothetical protein [Paenibacillus sp. PastF-2]MDF9851325.1 hypothetical protein [Paenibacillus sp. PastM-2]MDH6483174.1 hypothetical protein [Paenibacillus sp. PastH-2]
MEKLPAPAGNAVQTPAGKRTPLQITPAGR